MRARMAMATAGCDAELREVVLRDKPQQMLELSSKGTVPVLHLEDGRVLDESLDIMDWALSISDPDGWLRNRACERRQQLLQSNDGPFKSALDRYKYPNRSPEADPQHAYAAALEHLEEINVALGNQLFLDGQTMGFFDAAIFPFIRQFAAVNQSAFETLPFQALIDWHQRLLDHAKFRCVMKKLPAWKPEGPSLLFQQSLIWS